jgi:hypothetical protein
MKLIRAHVKNFQSVRDFTPFEINDVTCLCSLDHATQAVPSRFINLTDNLETFVRRGWTRIRSDCSGISSVHLRLNVNKNAKVFAMAQTLIF